MIYKLRNKNTGEVVSVEANSREEAAFMVSQGSSRTQNPQPTQSSMEKFGNALFGLGKNLASPFIRTYQRVGALGEETARAGTTNKAESLMKEAQKRMMAGDNSPEVKAMLDEAQRLSQGASKETTAQTNKSLTDPLQIAKDSAAMLSWGVPTKAATSVAGKTLPALGLAKGGAVSGGMSGFGYSSETSPEGLAGSTALGGILGYGVGKLGEAREAKKLARLEKGAKTGIQKAGYNSQRGINRPRAGGGADAVLREDEMIDFYLSKKGAGKSANEGRYLMSEVYKELHDDVAREIAASPEKISKTKIKEILTNKIVDSPNFNVTDELYVEELDKQIQKLFGKESSLGLDTILSKKATLRSSLGQNALNKINGLSGGAPTARELARFDVYNALGDVSYELGSENLKPLLKQMAMTHSIADNLTQAGKEAANLFGIPIPGVASTAQKLQSGFASLLIGKGPTSTQVPTKAVTSVAPNMLEQMSKTPLTTQAVSSLFGGGAPTPQQPPATSQLMEQPTGQTENTEKKITPDMMINAYMTLPKEDVAILEKIYKLQQETDKSTDTAADKKRKAAISSAEVIYEQLERAALDAPAGVGGWLTSVAGQIPGVEGGSAGDLKRVTEGYAKSIAVAFANEVGVATDTDVERWLGLMPQPKDTRAERLRALARLKEQMDSEKARLGIE